MRLINGYLAPKPCRSNTFSLSVSFCTVATQTPTPFATKVQLLILWSVQIGDRIVKARAR